MPTRRIMTIVLTISSQLLLCNAGCTTSAQVEITAADAVSRLRHDLGKMIGTYQQDSESADNEREAALATAFGRRLNNPNSGDWQNHLTDFVHAMKLLRHDRIAAVRRDIATEQRLADLDEIAAGLRSFATESLAQQEDAARMLLGPLAILTDLFNPTPPDPTGSTDFMPPN